MLPRISERNAGFETSTPAQRRVLIAQDVLAQLGMGQMKAEVMMYARRDPDHEDACRVCALGALAVSTFGADAILLHPDRMRQLLLEHFEFYELKRIERAFEGWGEYASLRDRPAARRLQMVMENIASNEGEFVGELLPVGGWVSADACPLCGGPTVLLLFSWVCRDDCARGTPPATQTRPRVRFVPVYRGEAMPAGAVAWAPGIEDTIEIAQMMNDGTSDWKGWSWSRVDEFRDGSWSGVADMGDDPTGWLEATGGEDRVRSS